MRPQTAISTAKSLGEGLSQPYKEGDLAEGLGRASFDVVSLFVGAGEVNAAAKTAITAGKAAKANRAANVAAHAGDAASRARAAELARAMTEFLPPQLPRRVLRLVNRSSVLTDHIRIEWFKGYRVALSRRGSGSWTDLGHRVIYIDRGDLRGPVRAVGVLAHELGHAGRGGRIRSVPAGIAHEGAAEVMRLIVARELGHLSNRDRAALTLWEAGVRRSPNPELAMGAALYTRPGVVTSTTRQPYLDYYAEVHGSGLTRIDWFGPGDPGSAANRVPRTGEELTRFFRPPR